jgi:Carboxypeptidase regulatory-like domain
LNYLQTVNTVHVRSSCISLYFSTPELQFKDVLNSHHYADRWNAIGGYMKTLKVWILLAITLVGSLYSRAQSTTSTLVGTVTDTTGAVIPGATITIINAGTGINYTAKTTDQGAYRVTQLPPGRYTMQVLSSGFSTQNVQAFNLVVDQEARQDITLGLGTSVETISVSESAQLLDTVSSNQGQVIDNKQIQDLPLNGRNFMQLAQLSAGVVPSNTPGMNSPASSWTGSQTVSISVAGLREDDTSYLFDGIEVRNAWYGAIGILPSIDNIQEFKIEQTGSTAAFGNAGTFVNIISRSGTNQIHGSVFEFIRNNAFDARNWFDQGPAPAFHQNQFGASVGGPIKKDKLFFFANYEGFRQIQPTTAYNRVPTAQERTGDFSAITQQLYNPITHLPYVNNQIPSTDFSPAGLKALAFFPLPNGSFLGGTDNYVGVQNQTLNWDQGSGRIDYTISDKNTVFARFTWESENTVQPGLTSHTARIFPSHPKNLATGWTHVFNQNIVNNLRFGWNYTETGQNRADGFNQSLANPLGLNFTEIQPGSFGPPAINSNGYGNPGSAGGTEVVRENLFMGTDSLLIQKGKHSITAGADIRYDPIYLYEDWQGTNIYFSGNYTGNYYTSNVPANWTVGDAMADLLIGAVDNSQTSVGDPTLNLRRWYQAYYAQDTVQVSKRLTLNGGIRYEYNQAPVDTQNHVGSFDFVTGTLLTYPDTSTIGLGRQMIRPQYANFSPRLGFNFVPLPGGNTVVKGGFGMYWLATNINQLEVMVDTPKYYSVQAYNNISQSNLNALQPLNFTLDQLYSQSLPGSGQSVSFINANNKTPLVYEYSLSVQQTFLKNWLFELSYMGSQSRHYETRIVINPLSPDGSNPYYVSAPPPNQCTPGTAYCYQGAVQENANFGTSSYNGASVHLEKRYVSGFSLLGNYTWSKCLGTPWQDQFAWHPLDLKADYGHCTYDQNQRLSVNSIYELPFGKNKHFLNKGGLANAIAGGWQASAIATFYTGPWFTLGGSQNLGSFVNTLPNITGPVNDHSRQGGLGRHGYLGPYFNIQNVQNITALGVQGNAGVSNIQSPGSATWDLSAFKTWTFADRYGATFRTDFFNAFNRVNFTGLSTGASAPNLGYLTGANAAREIQFSLRLSF